MTKKKRMFKKTRKRVLEPNKSKGGNKSRSPSGKSKDSKVAKLMKLAKARTRKTNKKVKSKSKKKRR